MKRLEMDIARISNHNDFPVMFVGILEDGRRSPYYISKNYSITKFNEYGEEDEYWEILDIKCEMPGSPQRYILFAEAFLMAENLGQELDKENENAV